MTDPETELAVIEPPVEKSKAKVSNVRDAMNGVLTLRMSNAVRVCMANVAAFGRPNPKRAALATGVAPSTAAWAWKMYRTGEMRLKEPNEEQMREIRKYGLEADAAMCLYYSSMVEQLLQKLMPEAEAAVRNQKWGDAERDLAIQKVRQVGEFFREALYARRAIRETRDGAAVIGRPSVLVQTNVHHANGTVSTRVDTMEQHGGSVAAEFLSKPEVECLSSQVDPE